MHKHSKNLAKPVAEEYAHRVWDDKALKAIDDLVDSNAVIHSLLGDFHVPASMKNVVQASLKGFSDLHVSNNLEAGFLIHVDSSFIGSFWIDQNLFHF